jgi:hypothetical protein
LFEIMLEFAYNYRHDMTTYFKGLLLAIALSPVALLVPSLAYAQTAVAGLEIKPAVVEDNVVPGTVQNYSLTVTNISNSTKTLFMLVQDIKNADEHGRPIFAAAGEKTGFELSSWIGLPVTTFDLPAGGSKTIPFTVTIPQDASPGSHFASVFFSDKAVAPTNNGSGVGFNVGVIVSLKVPGDITELASLREFSTSKLIYPSAKSVDFTAKVDNSGNVLVSPTGVIQITNMFGKQVANIAVNQNLGAVFPGTSRVFTANWSGDNLAFGRYEVVGSFVYGDTERKTISGTTSFWVLPLVPIGIVLGAFLLLVGGAYILMKSYIRRKLRHMGVTSASRADTALYQRKYQKSGSRLIVVTLVVILVCVVFLTALFLMFA